MKFSIIVPCYNLESWIRTCLDSVAAQSFADWECIVVDDESRDGSPAICDAYAAGDGRFKIIHQKNSGEGGARNAGLKVARGEWVFFLDGDDAMAPGALERLAKIIDRFPDENLIRFEFANFEDGEALPRLDGVLSPDGAREGTTTTGERTVDISRRIEERDYFVYALQFVFRRTLIADHSFGSYRRGADRVFIMSLLCSAASSFVATDAVCYFYRQRAGSAMNNRASVRVMKDELSHRADVIEMMDGCGKVMPYAGTSWLEWYCVRKYLKLVENSGEYSLDEQKELVAWFYRELPRLCRARGWSATGSVFLWLYRRLRGRFARSLLGHAYSWLRLKGFAQGGG